MVNGHALYTVKVRAITAIAPVEKAIMGSRKEENLMLQPVRKDHAILYI